MKLSYEWLNEFIDLSHITPDELGEKMSRTGIEVDSVTVPAQGMDKIVVGLVTEVSDHPDSDHLHIAMVDVAGEELLQIVCGAPNIAKGQKVIVALHGARIAGGHKIKRGKLRGIESQGMICSLQELGIPSSLTPKDYEEGIYVFKDNAIEVGADALRALTLDSAIVEMDLTANRSDALSVRGAVHEISSIYGLDHNLDADRNERTGGSVLEDWISVSVENTDDVPDYHIQIIKDVTIKPSPTWMQARLIASGIRPINNVVDVTNYVLLEYGQPLHAFDYDKLGSKTILVRSAKKGEVLATLDDVERTLTDEIVITNGSQPIALAGVMGGLDSEITTTTKNVALEFALFHPIRVRQASQAHNLRSDSSSRFEKGINKATIVQAGKRAAQLIAELSGGMVVEGTASVQTTDAKAKDVSIKLQRINHVLGTDLSQEEVSRIFDQLGFDVDLEDGNYTVHVPARRWDIHIEADLVEEVGRIYGYDRLPRTLPTTESTKGGLNPKQSFIRWTRHFLQGAGLSQAYTYALTTQNRAKWFTLEDNSSIALDLPMSAERSVLRQSIVSSLLEAVQYNVARSQQDIALFEIGRVFQEIAHNDYLEEDVIAGAVTGQWIPASWQNPSSSVDFFTVKGVLETYLGKIGCLDAVRFQATDAIAQLHPGQAALIYLNDQVIGILGQVHPSLQKELDLKATFIFELKLEPLLAEYMKEKEIHSVPKFPGMSRDIAILLPQEVSNASIEEIIKQEAGDFLQEVKLFDLYQGQGVEPGFKSLAYSLYFLNPQATLLEEEINHAMDAVTKGLLELEGVSIR